MDGLTLYLGLPDLRPDYVAAARMLGAPIMLSANSKSVSRDWTKEMRDADLPHPGFKAPPPGRLDGVRVALDSAGFTAMSAWGGYVVTPEQYADLATVHDWDFWSSQDLCCEPEISSSDEEVMGRIMETAWRYEQLVEAAQARGAKPPMKVLQGYQPWHYLHSAEALDLSDQDTLVGLGSVCKRQAEGLDGVISIVDRLDRELPKAVRFHCFGVTSEALEQLASHPRVVSTDSQSWGLALRLAHPTGRNNALAIQFMTRFWRAQQAHIAAGRQGSPAATTLEMFEPPRSWAHKPLAYRRYLAELLHAIRNGDLAAYMLPLHLTMWEMSEAEKQGQQHVCRFPSLTATRPSRVTRETPSNSAMTPVSRPQPGLFALPDQELAA